MGTVLKLGLAVGAIQRFYINDVGTVFYQLAEAFLEYFCKYHFPVFSHLLPIFHPSIRFGFPVPVTGKNWKLGEKWDFSQFPKKLGKLCIEAALLLHALVK